ncbi:MAG TPA: hypothetical protein VI072_07365 [Polyangiaceae bacterium]
MKISTRALAWLLFAGLVVLYHANWTEMVEGDTYVSISTPFELLETGKTSFHPDRHPQLFKWRSKPPLQVHDEFRVNRWQERFAGKSAEEWRASGHLVFNGPRYFLIESSVQRVYVSTFGPIPGMLLLPLAATVRAIDRTAPYEFNLKLAVGKLQGSLFIAGSATLLFLLALRWSSRRNALLVAIAYGAGSCVWAISSQSLWQQSVNQFFLMLGAYFLLGPLRERNAALLAGLAFGAAVATRATSAIFLLAVLVYLLVYQRKNASYFLLGAAPLPLVIAVYNFHFFGSPITFAQELVGHDLALEKTGSPDLWQTPVLKGLRGLLLSPSRGLLVFSPVFVLSFWGMLRIWRTQRLIAFRPLVAGVALTMALQCKWFDWWGGWSYGYRPWLDVMPFLALFMLPVLDDVLARPLSRVLYGALLAWSVFVQALGAFSYDRTWNERELFVVEFAEGRTQALLTEPEARAVAKSDGGKYLGPSLCNIDFPWCRSRLWSWRDSIILYQIQRYNWTRANRPPTGWYDFNWSP